MKLALRFAVVAVLVLASWFAIRALSSPEIGAVAPGERRDVAKNDAPILELPAIAEAKASTEVEADRSREEVSIPNVDVALQSVGATALLRVRVISSGTRAPVAKQVVAVAMTADQGFGGRRIPGAHAKSGEMPVTDSDGRVEFEIEPDRELYVRAIDHSPRDPVRVEAIAAGEQRDVEIEIPTDTDLVFCGRVIDAETRQPISTAVVWVEGADGSHRREPKAPTLSGSGDSANDFAVRADGSFELHARSWRDYMANAKADGYSRVLFYLLPGHETAERALEVRLSRVATLEVAVSDRGEPVVSAKVVAGTSSSEIEQSEPGPRRVIMFSELSWSATSSADGVAVLNDLPPRALLKVTVRSPGAQREKIIDAVTLEPGEPRRVEIHFGVGTSIVGRIEDDAGKPITPCSIWRVAANGSSRRLLSTRDPPVASAKADEQGRFRFDDVDEGMWLIGAAPRAERTVDAADLAAFPALAEPVQVLSSRAEVQVVLHLDRGVYITGTVVDPQGVGVGGMMTTASGGRPRIGTNATTDATGRFALGPLTSGTYTLESLGFGSPFAGSERVTANGGARDVILQLRAGGSIHGRVVDASGTLCASELALTGDAGTFGIRTMRTDDGTFELGSLLPGTYAVLATTNDALCSCRTGIVVREGETVEGIEIALAPAAKVSLRYDGDKANCSYELRHSGARIEWDGMHRGAISDCVVPAGEIEIRWSTYPESATHTDTITLAAGESREVVWDGKP